MTRIPLFISTYGRQETTVVSLRSLANSNLPDFVDVIINDDGSSLRTYEAFKALAQEYKWEIHRNSRRGLPSGKLVPIRERLPLCGEPEYFIICDSDMGYSKNWLQSLINLYDSLKVKHKIAAVTGFNTLNNRHFFTEKFVGYGFKESIGGCNILMPYKFLEEFPFRDREWDWNFCRDANNNNYKIVSTLQSLVQHHGMRGEHSGPNNYDQAESYVGESCQNGFTEIRFTEDVPTPVPGVVAVTTIPVPFLNTKLVYTCITGGYDKLNPVTPEKDWDYICFSDTEQPVNLGWKICNIPGELEGLSKVKQARALKIIPYNFVNDRYEEIVWVDAGRRIISSISELATGLSDNDLLIPDHPDRVSIYEEAKEILKLKKAPKEDVEKLLSIIKFDKYPEQNGLVQTGLLIRNLKNLVCKDFCERWWKLVVEVCHRDQLSFNYVLWKNPIKVKHLEKSTLNGKRFKKVKHNILPTYPVAPAPRKPRAPAKRKANKATKTTKKSK